MNRVEEEAEVLHCECHRFLRQYRQFQRANHLPPLPLPLASRYDCNNSLEQLQPATILSTRR